MLSIDDIIKKIFLILNKPTHYLFVGLFLLLCNKYFINDTMLIVIGGCFVAFSLASYSDFLFKYFSAKCSAKKKRRLKAKKKHEYIDSIIEEYENLGQLEKSFVRQIAENNRLVTSLDYFEDNTDLLKMHSVINRGWGCYDDYNEIFIFNNNILKILSKHIKEIKKDIKVTGTITRVRVSVL